VVVLVKLPVLKDPFVFLLPAHPFVPFDALHEVAFCELHVTVLDPP
jgi:hypothetical protein